MNDKIKEFLNYLQVEKNCSEKTLSSYKGDLEQFESSMEIKSIDTITKHEVREFLSKLTSAGNKPTTRNRKLTSLRSFCQYLCTEEYIDKNPTLNIPYANVEKRLPVTMTTDMTFRVIDSADGNLRDKAALETLYGTGCRVDELVHIKISDIDFEASRVTLIGKGDKQRLVPISVSAIVAIVDYLSARKTKSIYLFSGENPEKPITTKAMYNVVRKYGKANGVAISPHKFRHSVATHLLANGMDIRKIQELLGHENINTTTIYTQVVIDQMANEFHSAHPRG